MKVMNEIGGGGKLLDGSVLATARRLSSFVRVLYHFYKSFLYTLSMYFIHSKCFHFQVPPSKRVRLNVDVLIQLQLPYGSC